MLVIFSRVDTLYDRGANAANAVAWKERADTSSGDRFHPLLSRQVRRHDDPMPQSHDISYFAHTNSRAQFTKFGIKQADRLSHLYVIGKTGVGKTTLLVLE